MVGLFKDALNPSLLTMSLVFVVYFVGVHWMTHNCKGFWNDADGISMDEFASLISIGLWIYVGITLALSGSAITESQVNFFEVLTYLPLATVAKQAIMRIGWPSRRRRGYDPYDGGGFDPTYYPPQNSSSPPQES